MLYFITGGNRSGKSNYAQNIALQLSKNPVYVATARIWDEDFAQRVQKHKADRPSEIWTNYEEEKHVSGLDLENKTVVIDCITLWLTNFFMDLNQDIEQCLQEFQKEVAELNKLNNSNLIIISNEIGMGLHADAQSGRKFADLQGWANQHIANMADKAFLMVSGIPVTLK